MYRNDLLIKSVICGNEYDPGEVIPGEYTGDVISHIRMDGWYKPEAQANIKHICKQCSNKIVDTIVKLRNN